MAVFMCTYLIHTAGHVVRIRLNSLDCWSFKTFHHGLKHSKIHTARHWLSVSSISFSAIEYGWTWMSGHFREMRLSIITGSFYLWKRSCENLFNEEPFFVFHTESVMLGLRFIPGSVFYTQSIMLSPRFIPESVFYTQSVVHSPQSAVRSPQSAVRSPQSNFHTDRGNSEQPLCNKSLNENKSLWTK